MEQGIEDFNQMLDDHRGLDGQTLNEDKKSDYRDLRRRGKNRVAARDSREKKIQKNKHLKQRKAKLKHATAANCTGSHGNETRLESGIQDSQKLITLQARGRWFHNIG